MSTLASIQSRLIEESGYQPSEKLDDRFPVWMGDAVRQHNQSLIGVDPIPDAEDLPVMLLAWIQLCYARAGKYANEPKLSGANGYGADRDTPYQKNMSLALALQNRYNNLVSVLAADGDGDTIMQGTLFIKNTRTDAFSPQQAPRVFVSLSKEASDSSTITLSWNFKYQDTYAGAYLFMQNSAGIYQDWNFNTDDGIPQHSDLADLLFTFQDQRNSAAKITGLNPSTGYFFAVVVKLLSGDYYYSNELYAETTA